MKKLAAVLAGCALVTALVSVPGAAGGDSPDGKYKGNLVGHPTVKVTHKITGDGSKLKKFRARVSAVCVVGTSIQIEPVLVGLGSPKIKGDGSFKGRYKPNKNFDISYKGKLKRSKAKASGSFKGKINNCTVRKYAWKSRRK